MVKNLKEIAQREEITAHRVVFAKGKASPEVGKHWSLEPLQEGNFDALLEMAQRVDPTLKAEDAKIVTSKILAKDIDFLGTLETNAKFPYEEEILLHTSPTAVEAVPEVVGVEEKGEILNDLLPMPPESGPPLPRALGIRWPWRT